MRSYGIITGDRREMFFYISSAPSPWQRIKNKIAAKAEEIIIAIEVKSIGSLPDLFILHVLLQILSLRQRGFRRKREPFLFDRFPFSPL